MTEYRAFASENIQLVNRIEWDGRHMSLRSVGPEPMDDAAVVWPGSERTFSLGEVLVVVEFVKAIAGAEFTMQIEEGRLVWFYKFESDEQSSEDQEETLIPRKRFVTRRKPRDE